MPHAHTLNIGDSIEWPRLHHAQPHAKLPSSDTTVQGNLKDIVDGENKCWV